MDKLTAIRYFCLAADTLNFREVANQQAISPSVITRLINELEDELGEPLFKRNTRNISLTSFGEQFLPQAKQWLADSEKLFQAGKKAADLSGLVRITVPAWRENDRIVSELMTALEAYPDIVIDWREDMMKLDMVRDRIDIGVRVGLEANPDFVVRKVAEVGDYLLISPKLLAKLGNPQDLDDLQRRFPFVMPINANTGKPWALYLNEHTTLTPRKPAFYSVDNYSALQVILAGKAVGLINDFQAKPYLASGELVQLFPEIQIDKWQLYLYRPYQTITPPRVLKVFDLLTNIMKKVFA